MELNIGTLGPVVSTAIIGIIRAGAGWLDNALDDGKISKFEVGQLGGTIVRITVLTVAGYYAINGIFGTDITAISAGAGAFVADFILKKIKK